MPSRRTAPLLLAALLAVLLALPAPAGAAVTFTRTLIGGEAWDGSEVSIDGLNSAGHAAVTAPSSALGSGAAPYFWSREKGLVPIPLAGPVSGAWPVRINDADEVTGNAYVSDAPYTIRAFWWSPATGTRDVAADPAWNSFALSMNRFGAVGFVSGESPYVYWQTPRPYLWHPDNTVTSLAEGVGEPFAWPWAVNDAGQVVGGSFTDAWPNPQITPAHPFRYTPGRPVERLGAAVDTPYGNAHGINRGGDAIVTLMYLPPDANVGGDMKAILWKANGSVVPVAPPGGSMSEARYINDRGDVCGRYVADLPGGASATHAFYWSRETGPIDIGAAFPYDSDADGMNALGHVVGWYLAESNEWASLRGYFWSRETGVVDLGPGRAWAINDADTLGGYAAGPVAWDQQAAIWTRTGTVDPPPPTCSIPVLLAKVDALEKAGILKKGNANSLRAKLKGALAQGAAGKGKTAANLLFAFQAEVKALVKAGRLPAADGEALAGCSSTLCTAFRAAGNGTAAKAVGRK